MFLLLHTLKTADPTIVLNPTVDSVNVPINDVNNSGYDPPAAINVAPAVSGDISNFSTITSIVGTKNSSLTIAIATNI